MPKWRDFSPGDPIPATWADGLEEMLSDYVGGNFRLTKAPNANNVVQVEAGGAVGQVGLALFSGGEWRPRWATATKTIAHPGGAAGTYPVYAVGYEDSFGTDGDGNETNTTTSMEFGLVIGAPSGAGAQAISRQVGVVQWDGARIMDVQQIVALNDGWDPGDTKFTFAEIVPGREPIGWLACDGRTLNRADFPALFVALGGINSPFGLPSGTTFKLPDTRGRVFAAVDGEGVVMESARGDVLGDVEVQLTVNQMPSHTHPLDRRFNGAAGTAISYVDGDGSGGLDWSTGGAGGDQPHPNVQPTIVAVALIHI